MNLWDPVVSVVLVLVASEVVSEAVSEAQSPFKIMMMCYQEYQIHPSFQGPLHWMIETELTGGECQSQKGVKTSKVCQRSTIGNYTSTYAIYIQLL